LTTRPAAALPPTPTLRQGLQGSNYPSAPADNVTDTIDVDEAETRDLTNNDDADGAGQGGSSWIGVARMVKLMWNKKNRPPRAAKLWSEWP